MRLAAVHCADAGRALLIETCAAGGLPVPCSGVIEKAGRDLIKIALFLILGYVFVKLLKGLFGKIGADSRQQAEKPTFQNGPREINEMVQDPVCKIYVPKKEALHLDRAGTRYYFCSRACMDRFQQHNS